MNLVLQGRLLEAKGFHEFFPRLLSKIKNAEYFGARIFRNNFEVVLFRQVKMLLVLLSKIENAEFFGARISRNNFEVVLFRQFKMLLVIVVGIN